jgi:hypothetical protein
MEQPDTQRPQRMRATAALTAGIGLVNRAPVVLVCVFCVSFLAALPFSLMMREALATHLGNSMAAEQAAQGVNVAWWNEFLRQAGPLGRTFQTTIIGFAAALDNLSTLADGGSRPAPILWIGALYIVLWMFLSGGILDRYARGRPTGAYEFFAACGVYFTRFLRLAPFVALTYYLLFAVVHPAMFGSLYEALVRDVTQERTAFFIRLALYLTFGALLAAANAVFDYAKVRAVVEDRRSMIGAIAAAARFVRRNAGAVAPLYLLNTALFVGVLLVYALAAPGSGSSTLAVWLGIAVGQIYLAARLWARLVFLASETSLFQGRLAHAGYLARTPVVRPEPPVVERAVSEPHSRAR